MLQRQLHRLPCRRLLPNRWYQALQPYRQSCRHRRRLLLLFPLLLPADCYKRLPQAGRETKKNPASGASPVEYGYNEGLTRVGGKFPAFHAPGRDTIAVVVELVDTLS